MNLGWRKRGRACLAGPDLDEADNAGLNTLRSGATAQVCGVRAGCKARTRLASLGLIPGSMLHVVANPGFGPLLLSVGDSRLMVERGIAEKVLVRLLA